VLFAAAGTMQWAAAWVLIAQTGVCAIALGLWLKRHDTSLLAERLSLPIQSSQAPWDKALVGTLTVASIGWLVLMAFDAVRFGWSQVPISLRVIGAIMVLLNAYFAYLTLRENSYAATAVKIQTERGHRVVSTGPYAYVRHPMYVGLVFFYIGVPLLLGSWYGLAAAPLILCVLATRAVFEERELMTELAGYREYAERVRYRLIPGIW
jgi:protein-S-isoprenylcysteine O-methyltransferase Ste14